MVLLKKHSMFQYDFKSPGSVRNRLNLFCQFVNKHANLIGQVIFLVNKIFTILFFSSEMKIEKLKANKEQ